MSNAEIHARVNACILELEAISATGTHTIVDHLKAIRSETAPFNGSGSERYEAGDWTQSEGEGLTDDVSAKDITTLSEDGPATPLVTEEKE